MGSTVGVLSPQENESDKYRDSIAIYVMLSNILPFFNSNISLDEVAAGLISYYNEEIPSRVNIEVDRNSSSTFHGNSAYLLEYSFDETGTFPQTPIKAKDIIIPYGDALI